MESTQDLMAKLNELNRQLGEVSRNHQELKKDLQMIFADITHFETLVLKIMDRFAGDFPKEKYHQ